jgi:hypothetical protein
MNTRIPSHIVLVDDGSFVAPRLAAYLANRYEKIFVLTLAAERWHGPGEVIPWDGRTLSGQWINPLEGAAALVNLVGGELPLRKNRRDLEGLASHHRTIIDTLGRGLLRVYRVPKAWVQASSLSIYGETGDRICDESGWVPGGGISEISLAAEEALGHAIRPEMRWVILRTGLILSKDGGVLPLLQRRMRSPGERPEAMDEGSARWISWIHVEDLLHLWSESIRNKRLSGIFHATGLQPVTTAEFAAALSGTIGLPVGSDHGVFDDLTLPGGRCLPRHFHRRGLHFRYHDLDETLVELMAAARPLRVARPPALVTDLTV